MFYKTITNFKDNLSNNFDLSNNIINFNSSKSNNKLNKIIQTTLIQNNFNFFKNNNYFNNQQTKIATHIINTFFDNKYPNILINTPIFDNSNNKINITLFYYGNNAYRNNNINTNTNTINNNNNYINNKDIKSMKIINNDIIIPLSDTLANVFEKQINFKLIRIHYPYMNSEILAKYLISNASTNTFLHFSEAILTYPSLSPDTYGNINKEGSYILPAYITSIRLELSGRLMTEQVVPRLTKKSLRISNPNSNSASTLNEAGIESNSINNMITDYAKYSVKNELGSFTLKVWINCIITKSK